MTRAILLTGFHSWGKTSLIHILFSRQRFLNGQSYSINGVVKPTFTVVPQSNDDLNETDFINDVDRRVNAATHQDLFCAFCPTRDFPGQTRNDSLRILGKQPFASFEEIHVLLLKYKWDFHAELRVEEIKSYLAADKRVTCQVIDADARQHTDPARATARAQQIVSRLNAIYP